MVNINKVCCPTRYSLLGLASIIVFLAGCMDDTSPTTSSAKAPVASGSTGAGDERILAARNALVKLAAGGFNINGMSKVALEQPEFAGILGSHGGTIMFDSERNSVRAITAKVFDFETRTASDIKDISSNELSPSRGILNLYLTRMMPKCCSGSETIPIFSQSFRLAAAEATMNANSSLQYIVRRGSGGESENVYIEKLDGKSGKKILLAADAVYPKLDRLMQAQEHAKPPSNVSPERIKYGGWCGTSEKCDTDLSCKGNVCLPK